MYEVEGLASDAMADSRFDHGEKTKLALSRDELFFWRGMSCSFAGVRAWFQHHQSEGSELAMHVTLQIIEQCGGVSAA